MNETYIILLLSIPYLVDFIAGCMTFKLSVEILDLDEERQNQNKLVYSYLK